MPAHAPDNDPVWKAHPGGETLIESSGPASGTTVKLAAKLDALPEAKPSPVRSRSSSLLADLAEKVAVPSARRAKDSRQDTSPTASLAPSSAPVSQKISGGQLVERVSPVYPAEARLSQIEGTVTLDATVLEDGSVGDVKIIAGPPELAPAAVEAVKHWRYKPFNLDGKPVKNEIGVSVEFKLPSEAASR
jgi:TonB family protein